MKTDAGTAQSPAEWWAVLGSNQWPLPCETEVGSLRINDMRAGFPIATGTCYHVVSLGITQRHERSVPELSQWPEKPRSLTQVLTVIARLQDGA